MVGKSNSSVRSRSEEHTSELQSLAYLVCRLLLEKKKNSVTETPMSALRVARGLTRRALTIKFEGCYPGIVDSLLLKAGSGMGTLGFFFLMIRRPPISTPFPYPPLFR